MNEEANYRNYKINFKENVVIGLNSNFATHIRPTNYLREDEYANYIVKQIRDKVTPMQREMGKTQNIIMEGRDIGTVVFPNADVKIFLDCSIEERANRRYKQNLEKGIQMTYEEVLENIKERNRLETERDIAPFVKPEDAITVDSTNLSIDEVVEEVLKIIDEKL